MEHVDVTLKGLITSDSGWALYNYDSAGYAWPSVDEVTTSPPAPSTPPTPPETVIGKYDKDQIATIKTSLGVNWRYLSDGGVSSLVDGCPGSF